MEIKNLIKVVITILFALFLYSLNQRLLAVSPEDIRSIISSAGWLSPLLYIVLFFLRPLVFFPASVFSIVGGLAFGAVMGSLLAFIGAASGAILAYGIGRRYGDRNIRLNKKGKLESARVKFEEKGFYNILILRLLPIVNFDLISYGAGLAKVKCRDFIKATVIGIVPGTLIYTFLGASIVEGDDVTMIIAGTVYILLIVIPVIWNRGIMNHVNKIESK
ncbi:TVP38/TMEM64 family protein [Alkalibacillus aidingensis]|uniref:TVP38/TMEM64 family protein n=1 Tax=Alkalibacillus aidingensis TaxID=2747607 RepID=UPI0016600D68|nr:TVP38/TMEM64 family protein [Alkalibacillus aidingensis]